MEFVFDLFFNLGKLHINDNIKIIFLNLKKVTGIQKCRSFGTGIFLGCLLSIQSHWLFMECYFSDDKGSMDVSGLCSRRAVV